MFTVILSQHCKAEAADSSRLIHHITKPTLLNGIGASPPPLHNSSIAATTRNSAQHSIQEML